MRPRGFKRITVSIHREHEAAARNALARHETFVPKETIAYSGQHLSFSIDLAKIDQEGDAGIVEAVITRDVEGARP